MERTRFVTDSAVNNVCVSIYGSPLSSSIALRIESRLIYQPSEQLEQRCIRGLRIDKFKRP